MSTGVIIVLIVIVVGVVAAAAALAPRARGAMGGSGLKRRFGPEYDRTVARHDGDTKAAERELGERVQQHGSLQEQPLEPAAREQYQARWAAAQELFVDSPRQAVTDVDQLLGEVAGARGFPGVEEYEKQFDALSVHHADHVHGYRRVHRVVDSRTNGTPESQAGTEEMREAMLEARDLFDDLMSTDNGGHGASARGRTGRHAFGSFNRQAVKGS
ncbi:hypothetical protein R6V09_11770 [Streptomyces sp. W16]|uniref:hypothetical protein n=1 Tax=Streptomyces sp. W16 TaxID=3076631 RepID=UPI00295BCD2A|nr:hypothetical protein [Streptomyces sp. W16]MDV9170806.1 hypothetical protein [Streptomyces sp. W16]